MSSTRPLVERGRGIRSSIEASISTFFGYEWESMGEGVGRRGNSEAAVAGGGAARFLAQDDVACLGGGGGATGHWREEEENRDWAGWAKTGRLHCYRKNKGWLLGRARPEGEWAELGRGTGGLADSLSRKESTKRNYANGHNPAGWAEELLGQRETTRGESGPLGLVGPGRSAGPI
jgi:hypothetical protein